ncbi:MAG: hypothetical protein ABSD30_13715 [Candidatus Binatus sp.]
MSTGLLRKSIGVTKGTKRQQSANSRLTRGSTAANALREKFCGRGYTLIPSLARSIADRHTKNMSALLAKAFKKISEELPEYEQDLLAERLLHLLEVEDAQWDVLLDPGSSQASRKFDALVDKAREHFEAGRTEILDLKKL